MRIVYWAWAVFVSKVYTMQSWLSYKDVDRKKKCAVKRNFIRIPYLSLKDVMYEGFKAGYMSVIGLMELSLKKNIIIKGTIVYTIVDVENQSN